MKKQHLGSFFSLVVALTLSSSYGLNAQTKPKTIPATKLEPALSAVQIFGSFSSDKYDGQQVYLLKQGSKGVDTLAIAPIKGTSYSITEGLRIDTLSAATLRLGRLATNVVLEPGKIEVDLEQRSAKGTKLNEVLHQYLAQMSKLQKEQIQLVRSAKEEEQQAAYDNYQQTLVRAYAEAFKANKNNVIGTSALAQLLSGSLTVPVQDLRAYLGMAQPEMLSIPQIALLVTGFEALERTSPGNKYIDIEGINPQKESVRLSSFINKGHYTLVDFWASWCGPCRRAIPGLKQVLDLFAKDGLQIVGIAVWDKWDDHLKAVAEEEIPWAQIFNEKATEAYGIRGIPQIMLIAPNGTIVARDLHGQEGIIKLLEAEKSKNGGKL